MELKPVQILKEETNMHATTRPKTYIVYIGVSPPSTHPYTHTYTHKNHKYIGFLLTPLKKGFFSEPPWY